MHYVIRHLCVFRESTHVFVSIYWQIYNGYATQKLIIKRVKTKFKISVKNTIYLIFRVHSSFRYINLKRDTTAHFPQFFFFNTLQLMNRSCASTESLNLFSAVISLCLRVEDVPEFWIYHHIDSNWKSIYITWFLMTSVASKK